MSIRLRKFEVSGRGTFPVDMLRYDSCFPYRPEDSAKMLDAGPRTVTLITVSNVSPTIGRWNSFNWSCSEGELLA